MINWILASDGDRFRLEVIKTALRHCPKLIDFLFDPDEPQMPACPDEMVKRAGCFSSGEKLLVKFAVDVWKSPSSEMHLYVWDMVCILDGNNFNAVIEAMRLWRSE